MEQVGGEYWSKPKEMNLPFKRFRRMIGWKLTSLGVLIILMTYFLLHETENVQFHTTLSEVPVLHRLSNNKDLPYCTIPAMELYSDDQLSIHNIIDKMFSYLKCPSEDWTWTKRGKFYIDSDIVKRLGPIDCKVAYIKFVTDFKAEYHPEKSIVNGSDIDDNFFKVECTSQDQYYVNYHAGAAKLAFKDVPSAVRAPHSMNIFLIYFDSVSRPHWHRSLAKTIDFMTNSLKGVEFTGHSVMSMEGTPAELIPVLTGCDEYELQDSHRSNPEGVNIDGYPFIWKALTKSGYVPVYSEDQPKSGLWTYLRRGFFKKPMEHYMRPFYQLVTQNNWLCIGGKSALKVALDYLLDVVDTYNPRPIFAYLHNSELAHKHLEYLKTGDEDLVDFLRSLKERGILNNTVVFMASDHGHKYSSIRNTKQGKLEYMSPYSSIIIPPWFSSTYPKLYENLLRNAPLLTSAHDIHQTLLHIMDLKHYKRSSSKGWSLFDMIPLNRSCEMSKISPSVCLCRKFEQLSLDDLMVQKAVESSIGMINIMTAHLRDKCYEIKLKVILEGRVVMTDEGYRSNQYEVKFQTSPGDALYEVTLDFQEIEKVFAINPRNPVMRTNSYASVVHCLEPDELNVVMYCVCEEKSGAVP